MGGLVPRRGLKLTPKSLFSHLKNTWRHSHNRPLSEATTNTVLHVVPRDLYFLSEQLNECILDVKLDDLRRSIRQACTERQLRIHISDTYMYPGVTGRSGAYGRRMDKQCPDFFAAGKQLDFVLLPVFGNAHWSLAVVCYPNAADEAQTHVLLLNSYKGTHADAEPRVRDLLAKTWEHRTACATSDAEQRFGSGGPVTFTSCNVPQQSNGIDCGLYMLEFARCACHIALQLQHPVGARNWETMLGQTFSPDAVSGRQRTVLYKEFLTRWQTPPPADPAVACQQLEPPAAAGDAWEGELPAGAQAVAVGKPPRHTQSLAARKAAAEANAVAAAASRRVLWSAAEEATLKRLAETTTPDDNRLAWSAVFQQGKGVWHQQRTETDIRLKWTEMRVAEQRREKAKAQA